MNTTYFQALLQRFNYLSERPSSDHPAVNVPQEKLLSFAKILRDEFLFDMLVDCASVDWKDKSPRFTVVYHFFSTKEHRYLRVASDCSDNKNPTSESLTSLYPAANWHEREVFDMMGIKFEGHPDLRRILMWDEYPYHPLRKEFPLAGIEVELPAPDVVERTNAKVIAAPMMGGPFRSPQEAHMKTREPIACDESWTEKNEKPE